MSEEEDSTDQHNTQLNTTEDTEYADDTDDVDDTDDGVLGEPSYDRIASTGDPSEPRWKTVLNSNPGDIRWIKQLNRKECINFKPKSNDVCFCGRTREEHISEDGVDHGDAEDRQSGTWRKQSSVVKKETDTCGRIQYYNDTTPSLFIRLDDRTSKEDLTYLLNNILQVTSNDLYVHFVDFEEFRPQRNEAIVNRLKDKLQIGLKVLTEKTRVFLTSQGLKTGSSKYLHSALSQLHNQYGILPVTFACTIWGSVDNKDLFRDVLADSLQDIKPGRRSDPDVLGENLSPYFTHHMFVDDGTHLVVTRHLQRFMEKVQNIVQTTQGSDSSPNVVVLMNGGEHAVDHVVRALERNIPVIIVRGSGGYADEIARAYLNCRTRRRKSFDRDGRVSFRQVLNFDGTYSQNEKIRSILGHLDLITIFDPEPQTLELDMVIVWALLKAKQETKLHNLLASFQENSPCYSWQPSYTVQGENSQAPLNPHTYFLLEAMCNNSAAVVETIIRCLDLQQHFTMDNIVQLYNRYDVLGPCRQFLTDAKNTNSEQTLTTLTDVRMALQDVLGPCYPIPCTGKGCQCEAVTDPVHFQRLFQDPRSFRSCLPPIQEMFLWALFTNKQKLAVMLWKKCEDKLASALVGEVVLRKLARKEGNMDNVTDLKKDAEEFENLAVTMLKRCYQFDEEESHSLLLRNSQWWGGKSCLQLAVQFSSKRFISQQPCTSLLNKIWYGGISQYEHPFKKMFACTLSPIPGLSLMIVEVNKAERKGFSSDETKEKKTSCQKMYLFYTSPVVKYTLNLMSFISFLLLFSYVLLVDLQPDFTILQGVLCVYVATYLGEELRQVYAVPERSVFRKLSEYFRQFWNWLDVITILFFTVGMSLAAVPGNDVYRVRHILLNVDIFLFAMRLLQMFVVKKTLGPMLTMIQKMIGDTVSFMVILLVFVFSYGVVSHSILSPQSTAGWRLLYDVPRQAYWQIYGEFFLDDNLGQEDACSWNSSLATPHSPPCTSKYIVEVFLAVYAIVTHVLLLNILIAKFNFTFAKVQGEANKIWAWHRCQIIHEFHYRPWLPPPLNVFYCMLWLCQRLVETVRRKCRRCASGRRNCRPRGDNDVNLQLLHTDNVENKGAQISYVGCTCVAIIWDCRKLREYSRYQIKYRMKEGVYNPTIAMELCPTKTCVVRDLCPNSLYEFKMFGGNTKEDGDLEWQPVCKVDLSTLKEDCAVKDLKRVEKNLTKNESSHTTGDSVLIQRTEELGQNLSELTKLCSTIQQTSAGTLEQLTKDLTQLRRDQTAQTTGLEKSLQIRNDRISERLEFLETGFDALKENQNVIIKLLSDMQSKR